MKAILITVIVQAFTAPPDPGKEAPAPFAEVKAHAMQEFDSKEACINAAKGLQALSAASGGIYQILWGCVPKDLGKLEVEQPKAKPQLQRPPQEVERGSAA